MSSKRRADRQISKDDRDVNDSNDEQEVTYGITKASTEEISTRRIVRVKRPEPVAVGESKRTTTVKEDNKTTEVGNKEEDQLPQKSNNPFASIQLTSSSGGTSASIFGASTGFRGFGSIPSDEKKDSSSSTIFGASSGFQGFGSVASSNNNGFGTNTQLSLSAAPATFGGFASFSSSAPSHSFTFGTSSIKETETLDKTLSQAGGGNNDTNAPTSKLSAAANNNASLNTAVILPEDYVLESGEEGYKLGLELRCKSYRWMKKVHVEETKQEKSAPSVPSTELFTKSDKNAENVDFTTCDSSKNKVDSSKEQHAWVEQGVGPARILQIPNSDDQFARLTQRRQAEEGGKPTKVLINLLIGRESTVDPHTDKVIRVSSVEFSHEGTKPVLYLFRFKDAELTTKFLDCLKRVIQQAKSFQQTESTNGQTEETPAKAE